MLTLTVCMLAQETPHESILHNKDIQALHDTLVTPSDEDIQHLTISDKTDAVTELEERAKFGRSQILHQNQAHEEELQSTPLTRSLSAKGPTLKGRGNCRGMTCRALVKCNPGEAVFDGGSFGHAQYAARSGSQILAQQEEVAPETFGQKLARGNDWSTDLRCMHGPPASWKPRNNAPTVQVAGWTVKKKYRCKEDLTGDVKRSRGRSRIRMDGWVGFKKDAAACASACDILGRNNFVYYTRGWRDCLCQEQCTPIEYWKGTLATIHKSGGEEDVYTRTGATWTQDRRYNRCAPKVCPFYLRRYNQCDNSNWKGAKGTLEQCKAACAGSSYMTYVARGDKNCACQNQCTRVTRDSNSDLYALSYAAITPTPCDDSDDTVQRDNISGLQDECKNAGLPHCASKVLKSYGRGSELFRFCADTMLGPTMRKYLPRLCSGCPPLIPCEDSSDASWSSPYTVRHISYVKYASECAYWKASNEAGCAKDGCCENAVGSWKEARKRFSPKNHRYETHVIMKPRADYEKKMQKQCAYTCTGVGNDKDYQGRPYCTSAQNKETADKSTCTRTVGKCTNWKRQGWGRRCISWGKRKPDCSCVVVRPVRRKKVESVKHNSSRCEELRKPGTILEETGWRGSIYTEGTRSIYTSCEAQRALKGKRLGHWNTATCAKSCGICNGRWMNSQKSTNARRRLLQTKLSTTSDEQDRKEGAGLLL